jgi:hypothetical protein
MTTSWDLTLSIDAHGHDDTQVSTPPMGGSSGRQLLVRVGLVTVHCLDGASAMSAGLAWARARLHAREWLPDLQTQEDRSARRPPVSSEFGGAFPSGSVIFDGRQPWQVTPRDSSLAVTVGPLQVTVHDWTALDTHVRAWTEASAVATRLYPGKAMAFNQLVNVARRDALREVDAQIERRSNANRRRPRDDRGGRG